MHSRAIIIAGVLIAFTAVAEDHITGTWAISAQPECSGSGIWQEVADSNGVPCDLSIMASAHAEAYGVTGTATVYYATAGSKFYQGEYANGIRHGHWQMWYPNGVVFSSGRFDHGDFTGIWTWRRSDGFVLQTVDWEKVHSLAPSPPVNGYGGGEPMTRYADRIVRFGPYPSHLIEPYIITNASIVGEWGDLNAFEEFTRIEVSAPVDAIYTVSIRSYGCLAQHVSTNRATFANGVMQFDVPVCTYRARAFRKAFLVGDPESPRLFPESQLDVLERQIRDTGAAGAKEWINLAGEPRVSKSK